MLDVIANRDHVLNHLPWFYEEVVHDGTQTMLHIACICGRSTHVGDLVTWVPTPGPEMITCEWCQEPLEVVEHRGGRKYHPACGKAVIKTLASETRAIHRAANPVTVERRRQLNERAANIRWARVRASA